MSVDGDKRTLVGRRMQIHLSSSESVEAKASSAN
jgi:hypothetical protein